MAMTVINIGFASATPQRKCKNTKYLKVAIYTQDACFKIVSD